MRVIFESPDPEGSLLRDTAVERFRFAMRRLTWLVRGARIQLVDVNGPRGGVDKRCRVELRSHRAGTVVVTSMARDWRSALEAAVGRAGQVLMRAWRRGRERRLRVRRPIALGH